MNETRNAPVTVPTMRWHMRFGSNLAIVAIRLLSVAAGLAYVKSYTHALSLPEVSAFFYLSTLSYALNALLFVPVDFYMQSRLARLEELPVSGIRRLVVQVLAIGGVACIAFSAPLLWLGKLQVADLPAIYAVAALLYLCSSLRNLLNNRGSKVFVSSMLLVESGGRMLTFIAMAAAFGGSARTLMISSAFALAIELAVILVQARRRLPLSGEQGALDDSRVILRIAAPISGAAVCNVLQLQTYRVVYPLAGLSAASGIFGVVSNVGTAGMSACSGIFSQLYIPRLYQSEGASIRRYVTHASLLASGVLILAMTTAPLLVRLITNKHYEPYALAVGFGVVIEACNLIIGGYVVLLSIERRTGLLLKFNVIAASLSVIGCMAALWFAPKNPFLIGYFIAGSQLLVTFLLIAFARKRRTGTSDALRSNHLCRVHL